MNKPVVTCTRTLEWDAAHRVMRHESKCATLHGHRYKAEITCIAPQLDEVGRVIDFGVVKEVVGTWIDDNWDHTTLYNKRDTWLETFVATEHAQRGKRAPYPFEDEPTAENIAKELLDVSNRLLFGAGSPVRCVKVRVWETPNCYAEVIDTEGYDV